MSVSERGCFFVFSRALLLGVAGCVSIFFLSASPAHADEVTPDASALPPFASFTLNGLAANVELSSTTPSVEIVVSATEEAYFTRLYICPESDSEPCDGSVAIKFFSPNATTTAFSKTWDGAASGGGEAAAGNYRITARYFRYSIQPEAFEETAPYTVTVLGENEGEDPAEQEEEEEDENDGEDTEGDNEDDDGDESDEEDDEELEDSGDDEEEENTADNPALPLSTLRWTPFSEDPETGERVYGETVIFSDGAEEMVPFNTPGEISIETDEPVFSVDAVLFHIPDPNSPTREFVASLGGVFGPFELAWSAPGVYELDIYESEAPVLIQAPLWRRMLGWFVGYEAHAEEEALGNFIETIRFTVLEVEEVESPPEPAYAECCSSVIFLPGLKGSVLKTGSDQLWPPSILNIPDFSEDVLQLALDLDTGESVYPIVVDGILNDFHGTPIYEGFSAYMDTLTSIDAETGTSTIKAWEPFAYDWRFSSGKIIEDGDMIARLEELALDSDTGQVTIVAHSMGGLVGKELIRQLEEQGKEALIDSFVMVGSPQLGTPQAIASLLHGDDEGILGGLVVNASHIRTVAQHMPSAYSLLPSSRYFDIVSDAPILFNENAGFTEEWREYWGSSSLSRYLDFFSFTTGGGVARLKPSSEKLRIPEVLDPDLLADASSLHNELDSYDFPDSVRVVQVAGWGVPTTKAIEYKNKHLLQNYQLVPTREGDKTVVYPSAISSVALNFFFNLDSFNKLPNVLDFQHRDLLSAPPVQTLFQSVIKEISIEETEFITTTKPSVTDLDDQIVVRTNSPVILGVYDEFGNFTGIDQSQDLNAPVFLIVENIPGSYFLISGDSQSIFLPVSGTYTFVYRGTDDGDTTIEIGSFSNDQELISQTFTDIITTASTTATFLLSMESDDVIIEFDKDGDGTADETILSDEAKAAQEQQQENSEEETSNLPPSSHKGGGGIVFHPTITEPPPPALEEPSDSVPEVVVPISETSPEQESGTVATSGDTIAPVSPPAFPAVSEPPETNAEVALPQTESDVFAQTIATPTSQQAAAVQSEWYDVVVKFVHDSFVSLTMFLRGFF